MKHRRRKTKIVQDVSKPVVARQLARLWSQNTCSQPSLNCRGRSSGRPGRPALETRAPTRRVSRTHARSSRARARQQYASAQRSPRFSEASRRRRGGEVRWDETRWGGAAPGLESGRLGAGSREPGAQRDQAGSRRQPKSPVSWGSSWAGWGKAGVLEWFLAVGVPSAPVRLRWLTFRGGGLGGSEKGGWGGSAVPVWGRGRGRLSRHFGL